MICRRIRDVQRETNAPRTPPSRSPPRPDESARAARTRRRRPKKGPRRPTRADCHPAPAEHRGDPASSQFSVRRSPPMTVRQGPRPAIDFESAHERNPRAEIAYFLRIPPRRPRSASSTSGSSALNEPRRTRSLEIGPLRPLRDGPAFIARGGPNPHPGARRPRSHSRSRSTARGGDAGAVGPARVDAKIDGESRRHPCRPRCAHAVGSGRSSSRTA